LFHTRIKRGGGGGGGGVGEGRAVLERNEGKSRTNLKPSGEVEGM
jgi:hypothetical protein